MPSLRAIRRCRSFVARATSWVLLSAYVVVATGVPLPTTVRHSASSSNAPYPCQGGTCGCRSAEQCWKSCCCHSASERLAWARRNGVTPPEYLIAAAHDEQVVALRPCCAARRSCCTKSAAEPSRDETSHIVWISALDVQRCRGAAPTWHNVPISLPPQPPVDRVTFEPSVQPFGYALSPTWPSASFAPPDPPPRIA